MSTDEVTVARHSLFFRILHWALFVEGVLLTLTGLQLGGSFLGIVIFTSNNLSYHILLGLTFIGTGVLFLYDLVISRNYHWVGVRRLGYAMKFTTSEAKAWFGIGPKVTNPISYDVAGKRYKEKLVPSVITVFWVYLILGLLLAWTGLTLAYPAQMSFAYVVTDQIGRTLASSTGITFVLALHRVLTFLLVCLVAAHIYASFLFKLVGSMFSGKRNERVAN